LNILYITSYKYLKPRNGGQFCQYFTHQYLGKISNLYVAGVRSNDAMDDKNFTLLPVFSDAKLRYINPFYFFHLKKIIKEKEIEVVILEHPYLAWLVFLLKSFLPIRWVIRSENVEYLRFKSVKKKWWRILRWYETWAHKRADYVWCITQEDRKQIEKDIFPAKTQLLDFPYGTVETERPKDKLSCRQTICKELNISTESTIILFNGTLNYPPNRIGLDAILEVINPLLQKSSLNYKIIICGSQLPPEYNQLEAYKNQNILYCGFVDDITSYFKGADIFLNPIIGGGGIKTKLVDALASNTQSISTVDGAVGLYPFATGNCLVIIKDGDWNAFAEKIIELAEVKTKNDIPDTFYEYYGWSNNLTHLLSLLK
jgi:polysaccharide biosynthesis protein PslH